MTTQPRGPIFIALEGIDGSGTTTLCRQLTRQLEAAGRRVHSTREPSDGPVGRLIREILAGRWASVDASAVALLFAADRLDHLTREIRPALARGEDVVSDRYLLSSMAYQGRDGEQEWVEAINRRAPWPELTLFLEVPPAVCLERLEERGSERELFERQDTLEAVHQAYVRLLDGMENVYRLESWPIGSTDPLLAASTVILDGRMDARSVARAAWYVVSTRLYP